MFLVAACSSSGSNGGEASGFASAFCTTVRNACCSDATTTVDDCTRIVDFSASSLDDALADACVAELRAKQSDAKFCGAPLKLAPSCERALRPKSTGTKPPGEACSMTKECAPSSEGSVECAIADDSVGKDFVCAVTVRGKEGDGPCTETVGEAGTEGSASAFPKSYACAEADGIYCNETTRKCSAIGKTGAACSTETYACGSKGWCDQGKCAARRDDGAACARTETCQHGSKCEAGVCARDANAVIGDKAFLYACRTTVGGP